MREKLLKHGNSDDLLMTSTWGGEEKIIGNFYQEQLTRVIEQDEFIIEKVLRKKKGKLLVKFLGYLTPEWVSEKDITNIKEIHH